MRVLIKIVLGFPILGRLLRSFDSVLLGYAYGLYNAGHYEACLECCKHGLYKKRKKIDQHASWVMLEYFKYAINSALRLNRQDDYIELRDYVISRNKMSFGRNLAELIIKLSMWGYNFQDKEGGVELAKIAITVDGGWGEPEFLIGWYCLPKDDSVIYFLKSIEKDASYHSRIFNDKACLEYPELLEKLTRELASSSNTS